MAKQLTEKQKQYKAAGEARARAFEKMQEKKAKGEAVVEKAEEPQPVLVKEARVMSPEEYEAWHKEAFGFFEELDKNVKWSK